MPLLLAVAALLAALWLAGAETSVPPPGHLPPRTAWLLAFHEAQDATDVARMLLAAERLDRLGEPDLARHARRVAAEVARELAARPGRPPSGVVR
jgi:hypothetical protein